MTPNKDPDIRFGLANERTFLAWGRTCLTLVATGLVVARILGPDDDLAVIAGVALTVIGAVLAVLAFRSYQRNDRAIRADEPIRPSALPVVLIVTIAVAALVAVALSLRT